MWLGGCVRQNGRVVPVSPSADTGSDSGSDSDSDSGSGSGSGAGAGAGAGTDASRPPSDLVALLGSGGMDWGSIMVFSCEDSCDGSQEEFCVVVDPLA